MRLDQLHSMTERFILICTHLDDDAEEFGREVEERARSIRRKEGRRGIRNST